MFRASDLAFLHAFSDSLEHLKIDAGDYSGIDSSLFSPADPNPASAFPKLSTLTLRTYNTRFAKFLVNIPPDSPLTSLTLKSDCPSSQAVEQLSTFLHSHVSTLHRLALQGDADRLQPLVATCTLLGIDVNHLNSVSRASTLEPDFYDEDRVAFRQHEDEDGEGTSEEYREGVKSEVDRALAFGREHSERLEVPKDVVGLYQSDFAAG